MARLYNSILALSLVRTSMARQWQAAMETPLGLMATAGMSPMPTAAPGSNGIPKELLRRQNTQYQYPPPDNWCGFVEGDYANPLSCSSDLTCIFSGPALGCCTATTGSCTALYTSCVDYGDTCGSSCQSDDGVNKCPSVLPYCGTFSFFGGTYLYNCQTQFARFESVEYLNDFYITAIGSTLATDSAYTAADSTSDSTADSTFTSPRPTFTRTSSSSTSDSYSNSTGLAAAAIGGICAGVGVISIILGLLVWFCIRRRRNNRIKQAQQQTAAANAGGYGGPAPPQMQQQSPGYQPVPQQDGQYLSPNGAPYPPAYAPQQQQQQQGYFSDPSKSPVVAHVTPMSPSSMHDPRQSIMSGSGVVSPAPTSPHPQQQSPPIMQGRDSYYQAPANPHTMEVDGTQGNPGVPHGGQQQYQEVDGTQSNPGVPHHGAGHQQGPYEVQ